MLHIKNYPQNHSILSRIVPFASVWITCRTLPGRSRSEPKLPCLVRSLRSAEACLESQYSRIGLAQFGIQNWIGSSHSMGDGFYLRHSWSQGEAWLYRNHGNLQSNRILTVHFWLNLISLPDYSWAHGFRRSHLIKDLMTFSTREECHLSWRKWSFRQISRTFSVLGKYSWWKQTFILAGMHKNESKVLFCRKSSFTVACQKKF